MTEYDVPSGRPATRPTPVPGDPALRRLSLNQMTTRDWDVPAAVAGCVRAGVPAIGLWREPVARYGLAETVRLVTDCGLRVSSLCRGGFLTASDPAAMRAAVADNLAAIDEAAGLGAGTLVLVVGGLPAGSTDLMGARNRVADALAELAPHAARQGVTLGLEPMHPMFCADRGVLATLDQALDLAERFPGDQVGVVVDAYHVWWDPRLAAAIARAAGRIVSYQVCDWVLPLPAGVLEGRGMVGDGCVDLPGLTVAVQAAGYRGDIEVEIFNTQLWAASGDQVVATMARRYADAVWPALWPVVS